jgi:sugar/nucleoside kinase (ribokinase family)
MTQYAVTSICNALMDILVEVTDDDIKKLGLTKGIMHLVDSKRQADVFKYLTGKKQTTELGGSSLNAIRTLANLGHKTYFAGMISDDGHGTAIKTRLDSLGIASNLGGHLEESTGTCLILITPDGERTMNTNLGASRLYNESLVPDKVIQQSRIFHFSGYQWDSEGQKKALYHALSTAKKSNTLVSFDMADPFVVGRNQPDFINLIRDHADIVFANKEEARLLQDDSPELVAQKIADLGAIAVIKLGADGALIQQGKTVYKVKPVATKVVDTTAAGDMFAAGFLHGILHEVPLPECGHLAALLASDVISRIGATVSKEAVACAKNLVANQ